MALLKSSLLLLIALLPYAQCNPTQRDDLSAPFVFPNSTLLPHNTTTVTITAASPDGAASECRYAVLPSSGDQIAPAFKDMTVMAMRLNASTFQQEVEIVGASLTVVAVRCNTTEARLLRPDPDQPQHSRSLNYDKVSATGVHGVLEQPETFHAGEVGGVSHGHHFTGAGRDDPNAHATLRGYRAVGALKETYPRRGNLWGSYNFEQKGPEYAASHVDLWLGSGWSADETAKLRKYNNATLALTSTNAVEMPDGLPEVRERLSFADT